jgi:hypothetical protein
MFALYMSAFLTPSPGLFLTCRGEKYTVLIKCSTIYNDEKVGRPSNVEKTHTLGSGFDAQVRISLHSVPMLQVNCRILCSIGPTPSLAYP